jgi:hypothetical protein
MDASGRLFRTTNMKDLTMTTTTMMMMTTVGNGDPNLMKRSLNGGGGFPRLLEERRVMNEWRLNKSDGTSGENNGYTDPSNVNDRGRVPVCFLTSEYFCIYQKP